MQGPDSPPLLITAYWDFYDHPRCFVVEHAGGRYLFDCRFDDELDDYAEFYSVGPLPPHLDLRGGAPSIKASDVIGRVRVADISFDKTRRRYIGSAVLAKLGLG